MIKIYDPYITDKSKKYAIDAIESGWISSQGDYVHKAQEMLCDKLGIEHCILMSNGTTATHCLSKSIMYRYPKIKNIIVPNNVYVAAWNSFLFDSNYNPFIGIDCDLRTWNYDMKMLYDVLSTVDIETTALLCVHNLGNIINIPKIKRNFPNLIIVEDNCEGLFGTHEGSYSGTKSFCSSVSFFANKTITSGEGGAYFTNCYDTYKHISSFINQGNTTTKFVHDRVATNYRITNVQAAILCGQLEDLEIIREKKEVIFDFYRENLRDCENISFQMQEEGTSISNWMFGIKFENGKDYQKIEKEMRSFEVDTRPMFYCYDRHSHLLEHINSPVNVNAKEINRTACIFPSHPALQIKQLERVVEAIKQVSK